MHYLDDVVTKRCNDVGDNPMLFRMEDAPQVTLADVAVITTAVLAVQQQTLSERHGVIAAVCDWVVIDPVRDFDHIRWLQQRTQPAPQLQNQVLPQGGFGWAAFRRDRGG